MVTARKTRDDVIAAAGRLFSEKGYHGTSMRDLGRELGLLGSSLYSHVDSKQDLLVEVVQAGAALFEASAEKALATGGSAEERMTALVRGHVGVVLGNVDVVRTFLNEAGTLDAEHRSKVVAARDSYEGRFRAVIRQGMDEGRFRPDLDVTTASIFTLSILNAIERWYRPDGGLDQGQLVLELNRFVLAALG